MAKLIVGLGNIGKEYDQTNHNVGFMVLDKIADKYGISIKKNICSSFVGEANINGTKVIVAKPTTYMNLSGIAIKSLVKKYDIDYKKDLLVISDDIDLEVSQIRMRTKGSAGTHNGLKSVIHELGSEEFSRLRVGIGKPDEYISLVDFVLAKVKKTPEFEQGLEKAEKAALLFVQGEDVSKIMQEVR